MTFYRPCFNCAADKEACARRNEIRSGLKGLGVSSVNFRCDLRKPQFVRGQRVEFDWMDYSEPSEPCLFTFVGTITHEKAGNKRFVIKVDGEGEYYDCLPKDVLKSPDFVSVRHEHIRAIDEPTRPMCGACGAYDNPGDIKKHCFAQGDYELAGCREFLPPEASQ